MEECLILNKAYDVKFSSTQRWSYHPIKTLALAFCLTVRRGRHIAFSLKNDIANIIGIMFAGNVALLIIALARTTCTAS